MCYDVPHRHKLQGIDMAPPIKRTQYDVIEYLLSQWPTRPAGRLASMASRYAAFKGMNCKEITPFFQIRMLTGENRGSKVMPNQ